MSAGKYNFTIEQGATLNKVLAWQNPDGSVINLTGYTAKLQLRDENGVIVLDVGTSGSLTVNGTAGTVTIVIPASITSTLAFDTAAYDLKLTSANNVARLVKGVVSLDKQVSQ